MNTSMEPVTEVLQARARPAGGMESMLMLSLVAHGAVLAALVLVAPSWRGTQTAPREVMQISLSGSVGPPDRRADAHRGETRSAGARHAPACAGPAAGGQRTGNDGAGTKRAGKTARAEPG